MYSHACLVGCCFDRSVDELPVNDRYQIRRLDQCFHMLVNRSMVDAYVRGRAYLLSPGWLKSWRHRLADWGFDQATARVFFNESALELLLLDTGTWPEATSELQLFADYVGLTARVIPVGLDFLRIYLRDIISRWRLDRQRAELRSVVSSSQRRIADFSMALELLRQLTGARTEEEVLGRIFDLFQIVFAPKTLHYLPLGVAGAGTLRSVGPIDPQAEQRLAGLLGDAAVSDTGFMVRLGHGEQVVGVLEVFGIAFPEYRQHYVDLALSLADLCALAVQAARKDDRAAALEGQLRQALKMEAIGRLAGGVAHDFNNLLTGIRGYAELALGSIPASDPVREDIVEISRAAQRAGRLTAQLLAFSRRQVIELKVHDLNELARDARRLLRQLIGEHIVFEESFPAEAVFVKVDATQIDQVLMNLVLNARDAMPSGGKLRLEVDSVGFDTPSGSLDLPQGSYARLTVTDTGAGMDNETQRHLFEPFFTTKERGKGTGLGLATVYGIVRQHSGAIDVRSQLGVGSTFVLYFPLAERSVVASQRPEALVSRAGQETVVVVEDEPLVRAFVRRTLTSSGYRVFEAPDGQHALALVQALADPVDLLITDVVMPGLNGKELAERLVTWNPDLRVLFMSGYAENVIVHGGVVLTGHELLQKPFSSEVLLAGVRARLDRANR
jgi:signal transduction histidine kinase/CheY-like chemotaxis protein